MIPTTPAVMTGVTTHNRLVEPRRRFSAPIMMAYLDLDQLPAQLDDLPLWSARRRAWVHMRPRDFLDGSDLPLAPRIRERITAELGWCPAGPVHLLANLRTGGWLANPIVLYFAFTEEGELGALVAEVTNTPWHERHWYVVDARGRSRAVAAKQMHVSPFLPMDLEYRFTWAPPGPGFHFTVSLHRSARGPSNEEGDRAVFSAGVQGDLVTLDRRTAVRSVLRHPMGPLRASLGIYAHATVLLARRARFYSHPRKAHGEHLVQEQPAQVQGPQPALTPRPGQALTPRPGLARPADHRIFGHSPVYQPPVQAAPIRSASANPVTAGEAA